MGEKKLKVKFWPCDVTRELVTDEFSETTRQIMERTLNHDFIIRKIHPLKVSHVSSQILGEDDDPRIEYSLRINDAPSNDHLLCLLNFLLRFMDSNTDESRTKFKFSVVIISKEFFEVPFSSAQIEMPIKNFSFNNIIGRNTVLEHQKPFITQNGARIMSRLVGYNTHYTIHADFEHDRRQIIMRFPHSERQNKENGDTEIVDFVITMSVRYKSIRRILVDMIETNEQEPRKRRLLELYLHLWHPPVIRKLKLFNNPKQQNTVNLKTRQGDRHSHWKKNRRMADEIAQSPIMKVVLFDVDHDQYCTLLSRLSSTTDCQTEFRALNAQPHYMPFTAYVESPLHNERCLQNLGDDFQLRYMFEALLSRGAPVKDYLLSSGDNRDDFVQIVAKRYAEDQSVTLEVLERVLAEIDERLDCRHPRVIFQRIYSQVSRNADTLRQLHEAHERDGYVRVRKVVITPTRMLFVAPELLMGNRVLRMDPQKYPLEKFLRVVFRDDDGTQVHGCSAGKYLIERFIGYRLREGIIVAGRTFNYFGSSNSQLRDNGCYFMNATVQEIEQFRVGLGSFKIQSAPKMMSRVGQCFTQARETELKLDRRLYANDFDFEGGQDSSGKPYTFSDGVGRMSRKTAEELGKELKLEGCVPSCFQIRFRGYKGVLAVDPSLDNLREWGAKNGVEDKTNLEKSDCWLDLAIKFRPSQKKFEAKRDNAKLEIVKYSSPVNLCLNRPIINILDQVSGMQSHESHERICNRIHYLMDMYLHSMTRSLMDEQKARNKLGEFPKLVLYEQLTDMNVTTEPFFRGMIRASVRASLRKLRQKLQIPIPSSLGRAMFGIIDETGQLQSGQVFIRYTRNAFLKHPSASAARNVLKGPVMITKNPSIVAGDIRMFEAVDIPALRHLCDVVVFPAHGPRPHTNEMAGSDLDGDEYTIIWDKELYLDRNEEAFDYTPRSQETITTNEEELRTKMAEFFVDYISQDSIGRIANAFLVNSDLYGISSQVCQKIAEKHMEAVDFPKTGVPPPPLTTKWTEDEEEPESKNQPPEKPERAPDYMEKYNDSSYVSSRLNGQLFRRAKEIDDILSLATVDDESATVPLDPLINYEGCETQTLLELAAGHYEAYDANIRSIMDSYGIKTEGELFSGHYTSLRNRISDKDNDDMSFYNTSNAIEQRLFAVFSKFRRQFFETSLNGRQHRLEDITEFDKGSVHHSGGIKDVFRRICNDPPEELQRFACTYYIMAYDSVDRKLLSFAWLAWDVLNVVRRNNAMKPNAISKFSFDPLSEKITQHMDEYLSHRQKEFREFLTRFKIPSTTTLAEEGSWKLLDKYCRLHKGLEKLMFFCIKWARTSELLNGPFNELHICLLLLKFGLNELPCDSVESVPFFIQKLSQNKTQDLINLEEQHGGLGKKFIIFLEYLASRQFVMLECLDFSDYEYESAFYRKQWLPINKRALNAFHQIAFTFRFDSLPSTSKQRKKFQESAPIEQLKDGDPFIIEIPANQTNRIAQDPDLMNRLCMRTGCTQIIFRVLPKFHGSSTMRICVSMRGTVEAINNLRAILSVKPNLNTGNNCRQMSILLAASIYEKLTAED
ncbi:RNA dependent RNA polymerase domain-containing protein [Ditylenchus destructor]|uniref:RNA-directed RNA polymerase n=1 Tax=Ditylenchus destructor TaxID=166010 RepID=A0AAD4RCL5_9BILA|nr:RNA dependent RNA polymerase domain-containing protein [Ditylenchus destructor]